MDSAQPTAVFFCMEGPGHFQALRPVIARIAAKGLPTYVFTHHSFQDQVERGGGMFVDLYANRPLAAADDESMPVPCRFVTFAAHYANALIDEVRRLNPALIVYDSFAVIGPVVARALGVPYVSVCANHNLNPARCIAELRQDKRVAVSPKCDRAVEQLRTRFGLTDASPFSYVTSLSPHLNLYCEPPQFLDKADRTPFKPLAFFGSLPDNPPASPERADQRSHFAHHPAAPLCIYISFGTVIWRYFSREAIAVLNVLSKTLGERDEVSAVISLWGAPNASDLASSLENHNVRALPYVKQTEILEQTDLFVTHHGLNSTHEAIRAQVPMLSYPFFWDQPALARKCQQFGLASPLTNSLRGTVTPTDIETALTSYAQNKSTFAARLAAACAWEEQTIAGRDTVMDKILALIQPVMPQALLQSS